LYTISAVGAASGTGCATDDTPRSEEAYTVMGAVIPVIIVAAFWMIVGVAAVWFFRQALSVPTEMEEQAKLEQAALAEHAETAAHAEGADTSVTTAAH
jgi:hypothetical protein